MPRIILEVSEWLSLTAFREHQWFLKSISYLHYNDVIMGTMASQITSLTNVYSIVYSGADQRKHQSSASLAFVRGIHLWPVNSPHKGPVTRKMLPSDDVTMAWERFPIHDCSTVFRCKGYCENQSRSSKYNGMPGPVIKYETTKWAGIERNRCATGVLWKRFDKNHTQACRHIWQ